MSTAQSSKAKAAAFLPEAKATYYPLHSQPTLKPKPKPAGKFAKTLEILVTGTNSASMGLIFAFRQFLPTIFRGLGRSILFPFNVTANLTRAVLSIYEVADTYRRKAKLKPVLIRMAAAVLSSLAIATAILGSLLAQAAFAVIGPCLSMLGFSVRALYSGGLAISSYMESFGNKTPQEKKDARKSAMVNALGALGSALNVIAIGLVLLAFKAAFGIMGIVAAVINVGVNLYSALALHVESKKTTSVNEKAFNTGGLYKDLGAKPRLSKPEPASKESPKITPTPVSALFKRFPAPAKRQEVRDLSLTRCYPN